MIKYKFSDVISYNTVCAVVIDNLQNSMNTLPALIDLITTNTTLVCDKTGAIDNPVMISFDNELMEISFT